MEKLETWFLAWEVVDVTGSEGAEARLAESAACRVDPNPNQSEKEGGGSESDGAEFWTSP